MIATAASTAPSPAGNAAPAAPLNPAAGQPAAAGGALLALPTAWLALLLVLLVLGISVLAVGVRRQVNPIRAVVDLVGGRRSGAQVLAPETAPGAAPPAVAPDPAGMPPGPRPAGDPPLPVRQPMASTPPSTVSPADASSGTAATLRPVPRLAGVSAAPQPIPARLTILEGPAAGQVFRLDGREVTVGRSSQNDMVIGDNSMSRRHCRLHWADGDYVLEDLGSSNGTFVNNETTLAARLRDGDRITLGDSVLEFTLAPG
jgi:hypothetical protein